jgi:hypothetical protein
MREIRTSGSEGGAAQANVPSLPLYPKAFCIRVSPANAGSLQGVRNNKNAIN